MGCTSVVRERLVGADRARKASAVREGMRTTIGNEFSCEILTTSLTSCNISTREDTRHRQYMSCNMVFSMVFVNLTVVISLSQLPS